MTVLRQRSYVDFYGDGRSRAGFTLDPVGMASWPLPLPDSLLFGEAPSGLTGSPVTDWTDQAGLFNLAQGTAASRPALGSINGHAAASFDGTSDQLRRTSVPFTGSAGEIWIVAQATSRGDDDLLSFSGATTDVLLLQTTFMATGHASLLAPRLYCGAAAGTPGHVQGEFLLATGVPHVLRFASNGSAYTLWVNGAAHAITVVGAGADNGNWFADAIATRSSMGCFEYTSGTRVNFFTGLIGFAMVLDGANYTDSQARQWSKFLCSAFGATYAG